MKKCYCKENYFIFQKGCQGTYEQYSENHVMVYFNNGGISFDIKNSSHLFSDYFYTEKQYRKLKLQKLNERR